MMRAQCRISFCIITLRVSVDAGAPVDADASPRQTGFHPQPQRADRGATMAFDPGGRRPSPLPFAPPPRARKGENSMALQRGFC